VSSLYNLSLESVAEKEVPEVAPHNNIFIQMTSPFLRDSTIERLLRQKDCE
jgi:hypothetical protein